ncbi:helix-turn-helix domain-containing protein [Saccharopolyspora rectivirgula]|nr:helix-turn-helix transcriptional regulator [Saccharopolyspora rectivirgula]
MFTAEQAGALLRQARTDAGISLAQMAILTNYSKSYLCMLETGQRAISVDIVIAYERVIGPIGNDMWRRRNITHPRVMQLKRPDLLRLVESVEAGTPGSLLDTPTSLAADELLARRVSSDGASHLRAWMKEGKTATLRVNSLSILARRGDPQDAPDIIQVLEEDPRVRRLSLASSVSRLMQYDWSTCLGIVDDPATAPDPERLAKRLARDATDVKHAEARWCGAYLLKELAPVLAR